MVELIGIVIPLAGWAEHNEHHNPPGQQEDHPSGQEVANGKRRNILFTLQDKVIKFNEDGTGVQVGTATGKIEGVSITNFAFDLSAFPLFSFDNRLGITDTDGDQIIFQVLGEGIFVAPLADPTMDVPAEPADPNSQVLFGAGGPVNGTYEVLATSGKYSTKYAIGDTFPFEAVGYNPNPFLTLPEAEPLGAVYVKVFSNRAHEKDEVEEAVEAAEAEEDEDDD